MRQEKIIDRVPPHSIDAEVCVLGAMMLESTCAPMVCGIIKKQDFYRPAHQLIFSALVAYFQNGKAFDLVLFKQTLIEAGQLEQVGGMEYIVEIVEGVPIAGNAEYYTKIVWDKSRLRGIIVDSADAQREAYDPTKTFEEVWGACQEKALKLKGTADTGDEIILAGAAVAEAVQHADEVKAGKASAGLLTGFGPVDRATSGMQDGSLWTLAGATSVGKTALALAIVANVAQQGGSALCVSAEMGQRSLANRLLQSYSRIDASRLRCGNLDQDEYESRTAAAEEIDKWKVAFQPKAATVGEIAIHVRQLVVQWGQPLGLAVVDHLQLMNPSGGDNRAQQVSGIARGLKDLAMETGTPILMLSQLNREGVKEGRRPTLHDLKESGDIENHSDVVMLLHRPEGRFDTDGAQLMELKIAKARDGMVTPWPGAHGMGGIRLRFRPEITAFEPSTL